MKPFGNRFKINIDFILHWKLFDITENEDGDYEFSVLFIKAFYGSKHTSYYVDSCGIGLDVLRNKLQTIVDLKLMAFTLKITYKRNLILKVYK